MLERLYVYMPTHTVTEFKTRLDKFLAGASGLSRGLVQKQIYEGYVQVNKKVQTETDFVVRAGDVVAYHVPSKTKVLSEKKIDHAPLNVLYNDNGLLIIDKPAGLVVHEGAGFKGSTLASMLLYQFKDMHLVGEEGRSGIVHRLDKDTSGAMLIALTQEMYEHLKDAFSTRRVKKEYIALVVGHLEKPQGVIDLPIGKSKSDFRKYTAKDPLKAKPSLTEYRVLEYLDGYTLVRLKLHTGRTHQIRVHMQAIGFPLAGDALYGQKKASLAGLTRQFLHSFFVEVQLPDKTWIAAESKLPEDLRTVLKNLHSNKLLDI